MPRDAAPSSRDWASRNQKRRFRAEIVARDGTHCHWCDRPLCVEVDGSVSGTDPSCVPTIDHVLERRYCSREQVRDVSNMVLACARCNNTRDVRKRMSDEFPELSDEDLEWINDPLAAAGMWVERS